MDCGAADVKGLALIKAVTKVGTIYGDKGDEGDDEEALDEKGIFNFGKWAAKLPQRYEPYFGSHRFWYEGRLFVFDRSKRRGSQACVKMNLVDMQSGIPELGDHDANFPHGEP
jgi:hypothetical protein